MRNNPRTKIEIYRIDVALSSQDTLVYPVLFLYRQYLELQLKLMVRTLRHLQSGELDFPKGHKIDVLWSQTAALLGQAFPDESMSEIVQTGRLIGEFAKVDPLSTAFRYPVDNNGNPSLPGISYINIRNVRDVMEKIAMLLEGAYTMAYEHLQHKLDMEREFRGEFY